MAKRGRKRKSKITSLSSADKNHLKRIMKKVRQIKANKAASQPAGVPNKSAILVAQNLFNAAQQAYNNFISRGLILTTPTNQNTLNQLTAALNAAAERLARAQQGLS